MLKTSRLASLVESIYFEKKTLNIEMRLDHQNVFSISGGKDLGEGLQNVSQLNLCKIAVKVNSRKGLFGIFAAHGVMATSSPGFSRFPICRRRCRRWKTRRPWGRGWGSWRFLVSNGKDHGKVSKRQRLLTTAARATSEFKKPTRQSLARLSPFDFKCLQC